MKISKCFLKKMRLPRREGQGLRKCEEEREAAEVHPGRRHGRGPSDPLRHCQMVQAGRAGGLDADRHREPAAPEDDGPGELRHADLRRPHREGRGEAEPADGG